MNNNQKPFAFKLAEENQAVENKTQWQARDGVAVAGCSSYLDWRTGEMDVRETRFATDDHIPC